MRKAGRSASHCSGVSAAAAVVITVVMVVTIAEIAAPVSAAAAEDQDEDDDQPQAGAVIVSVVKPHESHLALSLFYASGSRRESRCYNDGGLQRLRGTQILSFGVSSPSFGVAL